MPSARARLLQSTRKLTLGKNPIGIKNVAKLLARGLLFPNIRKLTLLGKTRLVDKPLVSIQSLANKRQSTLDKCITFKVGFLSIYHLL